MFNWLKRLFTKQAPIVSPSKLDRVKAAEALRQTENARNRDSDYHFDSQSVQRANDRMILAGIKAQRDRPHVQPSRYSRATVHTTTDDGPDFLTAMLVAQALSSTDTVYASYPSPAPAPFYSGNGGDFGGGGASSSWDSCPAPSPSSYESSYSSSDSSSDSSSSCDSSSSSSFD